MTASALRIGGNSVRALPRRFAFTITTLAALKVPAGRKDLWVYDTKVNHLAYRLMASGAAAFYLYRRYKGRPNKVKIGSGGAVTIEQARKIAAEHNGVVARGLDPIEERRRRDQAAEIDRVALRKLWDDFITDKGRTSKPGTISNYKLYMEGPALRAWLDRPANAITADAVFAQHRKLGDESGHAFANGAMRVLRAVFNLGLSRGKVNSNPTVSLKNRWFKVGRRTSRVADDQLADWFKAIAAMRTATIPVEEGEGAGESFELPDDTARVGADLLEFILFTGMRRNEASKLEWDRVDLKKKTVTVFDTKNSNPLVLPVSGHLFELLRRRHDESGASPWVFPSPGRKGKSYFTEPRYAIERLTKLSGIKHTVHDLRRTFVTAAGRLVPHAVAKVLVNHTAKSDDITIDYFVPGPEELRPHVEKISQFFLAAAELKKPNVHLVKKSRRKVK